MSSATYIKKGFTLLELLISISVVVLLSSLSFPFVRSFQIRSDLDVTVNTMAQGIRRAQGLSMASESDSVWGVSVIPGDIVVYRGTTYGSRDTAFDEKYSISGSISASGVTDISFAKVTGLPSTTGTLSLTSEETRTLTINGKGIVSY